MGPLTKREKQIVRLTAEGCGEKEIAHLLEIAVQ